MAQYQLPNDFFFGAAMSGPQTEGQWNQGGKLVLQLRWLLRRP